MQSMELPDCRNLGVNLRILMLITAMMVMAAFLISPNLSQVFSMLLVLASDAVPLLFISLLILYLLAPVIKHLPYKIGIMFVCCMTLSATIALFYVNPLFFYHETEPSLARSVALTLLCTLVVIGYFNLRRRALSPAINEARLQALQARIRPHFLFNCINGVLSIVRTDPKRAETALEDMADLFRVLMADNRDLVPLSNEIALCKQYCALEKLRLEERLSVVWSIDETLLNVMIPPLVLQPLLENAVYYGIEPLENGGEIVVLVERRAKQLHIEFQNPICKNNNHHKGNHMALENIRERLSLHFDAEANLNSRTTENDYQVEINFPLSA